MGSEYRFKNSYTISQCEDPNNFKDMYGDVDKGDGDVSSGHGFLKQPHTLPMWIFKHLKGDIWGCLKW